MNGDRIQGSTTLETIEVQTLIGRLTVSMKHIKELSSAIKPKVVIRDSPAKRNRCINQLRMIDSAKEQTAMERHLTDGAVVTGEQISGYLRGGWKGTKCPAGGTYKINAIGKNPECSVPGHKFPY